MGKRSDPFPQSPLSLSLWITPSSGTGEEEGEGEGEGEENYRSIGRIRVDGDVGLGAGVHRAGAVHPAVPGLLFQIPGKSRIVEFGNFQTSGVSIVVHALIFFALLAIFIIAIGVHMFLGT
uniref:Uncharacterized protein n=1 Tax=Ananas comosus var. bracteatus TaxID=296719 RepID=A0A6V7NPC4_ANACO|nr:unnamed protein product [Ananas comosus var. bracteatus]